METRLSSSCKTTDRLMKVRGSSETVKAATWAVKEFLHGFNPSGKSRTKITAEVKNFIKESLQAVTAAKGDAASAVYGMVTAFLKDAPSRNTEGLRVIEDLAGTIISATAQSNGSVDEAAKGLIEGIVERAKPLKLNTSEAVSQAATAAVRTAYQMDPTTGQTVQEALSGTLSGIRIVLKDEIRAPDVLFRLQS